MQNKIYVRLSVLFLCTHAHASVQTHVCASARNSGRERCSRARRRCSRWRGGCSWLSWRRSGRAPWRAFSSSPSTACSTLTSDPPASVRACTRNLGLCLHAASLPQGAVPNIRTLTLLPVLHRVVPPVTLGLACVLDVCTSWLSRDCPALLRSSGCLPQHGSKIRVCSCPQPTLCVCAMVQLLFE